MTPIRITDLASPTPITAIIPTENLIGTTYQTTAKASQKVNARLMNALTIVVLCVYRPCSVIVSGDDRAFQENEFCAGKTCRNAGWVFILFSLDQTATPWNTPCRQLLRILTPKM